MTTRSITTAKGITCSVEVFDGGGDAVLAFHGVGGHLGGEPTLAGLAERGYTVYAPVWPGFGEEPGEGLLEDMLDFALHGADVGAALGLERPHLYGHSFGGMIAAEMVALAPALYRGVGLVAPAGLWLDEHPVVDIYTLLPYEFPGVLLHDPEANASLLTGGVDFEDPAALTAFLIGNSRRLGTAGKILFPIPNRRLSKRLYRVTNRVELVWGESDVLIPPIYAGAWNEHLTSATAHVTLVADAAHLAPYEQPEAVADALAATYGAA